MSIAHSKLTSQGQISVPVEVRRKLGLSAGSVLQWDEEEGKVVVRKAARFSSQDVHAAVFPRPPKRRSLKAIKASVAQHLKNKHARD